jgi:hypothetical protein
MLLVPDHEMGETLAADSADHPFHDRTSREQIGSPDMVSVVAEERASCLAR